MRNIIRPSRGGPARAAAAVLCLGLLAGCSLDSGAETDSKQVVVATHDSWNMSKKVLAEFTDETGYTVKVQPSGDAGELTNKLVLSKDAPVADLAYGVDNTFASRAVEEGVFADYRATTEGAARFEPEDPTAADQLTPVDYSDVCVNIDDTWFDEHGVAPPTSLDDLADPTYRGLFVTPAPSTSSPGLAFLLTTIARYGDDGWQDYWRRLTRNDVKITSGWSDAYQVDFTAGGGDGDRPIVLSYASSPPFTVPEGGDQPTTSALLDTCFRQVEYAGVLAGAENPEGAQAFIDFMVGKSFQRALPDNMYVYPVSDAVQLPSGWKQWAPTADEPWTVPPKQIDAHRNDWLRAWQDVAQ